MCQVRLCRPGDGPEDLPGVGEEGVPRRGETEGGGAGGGQAQGLPGHYSGNGLVALLSLITGQLPVCNAVLTAVLTIDICPQVAYDPEVEAEMGPVELSPITEEMEEVRQENMFMHNAQ